MSEHYTWSYENNDGTAMGELAMASVTFPTQADAEAWLSHGRDVLGWKPATVRDRRSTLRVHLLPAFGDRRARDIDRDDEEGHGGDRNPRPAESQSGCGRRAKVPPRLEDRRCAAPC